MNAVQTVVLAFQHYIVMLGTTVMVATVLVPRMGGVSVCKFTFAFAKNENYNSIIILIDN